MEKEKTEIINNSTPIEETLTLVAKFNIDVCIEEVHEKKVSFLLRLEATDERISSLQDRKTLHSEDREVSQCKKNDTITTIFEKIVSRSEMKQMQHPRTT
ncbi:unnamed protein product [Clavelina lepadiformis]|uniref:Uncharacterized protein n=1 Tax=Clavelina lepadiformis TaxID=159417 RepID=A0ABP0G3X1_CLALP